MDPVAIKELMTRWTKQSMMPRKGLEAIEIKALQRIPFPPQAYIEMKCTLQGTYGEARWTAIERFFKRMSDFVSEIKIYQERLLELRNYNYTHAEYAIALNKVNYAGNSLFDNAQDPIERIQTDSGFEWMMLVDFDFKREHGKLKMAKIYMRLNPEKFLSTRSQD